MKESSHRSKLASHEFKIKYVHGNIPFLNAACYRPAQKLLQTKPHTLSW